MKTTRFQRILNPNYVNGMEWMERAQKLEAINAELLEALEAAEQYLEENIDFVEEVPEEGLAVYATVLAAIQKAKGEAV